MGSANPQPAGYNDRKQTADKLKARFRWLNRFTDDELRDISFCSEGESMQAGEEYFDLSHPEKGVFSGQGGKTVPEGSCYVAKSDLRPRDWQKLVSVTREEYT